MYSILQIRELEEQLRDVLFFLSAKSKIENEADEIREEIAGGSILLGETTNETNSPSTSNSTRTSTGVRPRKNNRKK